MIRKTTLENLGPLMLVGYIIICVTNTILLPNFGLMGWVEEFINIFFIVGTIFCLSKSKLIRNMFVLAVMMVYVVGMFFYGYNVVDSVLHILFAFAIYNIIN